MRKECRNYWTGILLKHFWCKAILGIQFALLLFLCGLTSSILFLVTGLSFVVKRPLVKKQVLVTYSNFYQAFLKRTFCCEGDLVEKMQSWYLLCSSDFFCGRTLWGKEILVEKLYCGYSL